MIKEREQEMDVTKKCCRSALKISVRCAQKISIM